MSPGFGFTWIRGIGRRPEAAFVAGESGVDAEFRALERALADLGLGGAHNSLKVLEHYRSAIVLWNRRVNLVSRRDEKKLIRYHFLDCAEGLAHLRDGVDRRVLDLGSGAGFPGVVWKILRPDLEITLVDSIRKRALFLESVVETLGLEGVGIVRDRGEALAEREDFAGRYDVSVARTVAPLWRLVGMCMPLVRPGGRLLAFKGRAVDEEVAEARPVLEGKGAEMVGVAPARSEMLRGKRTFVVIEKKAGL
jgi:16S rRNA (guanine527-N7)-methyltransferase